jgi:Ubiquitin interaction motif
VSITIQKQSARVEYKWEVDLNKYISKKTLSPLDWPQDRDLPEMRESIEESAPPAQQQQQRSNDDVVDLADTPPLLNLDDDSESQDEDMKRALAASAAEIQLGTEEDQIARAIELSKQEVEEVPASDNLDNELDPEFADEDVAIDFDFAEFAHQVSVLIYFVYI